MVVKIVTTNNHLRDARIKADFKKVATRNIIQEVVNLIKESKTKSINENLNSLNN
jgi:predicted neutral ceramidase superfamily lipid hydrolase